MDRSGPCTDLLMYQNGPCTENGPDVQKSTVYHKNVPIWPCSEMDMCTYGRYPRDTNNPPETVEEMFNIYYKFIQLKW